MKETNWKKWLPLLALPLALCACNAQKQEVLSEPAATAPVQNEEVPATAPEEVPELADRPQAELFQLEVNGKNLTATWAENSSADALRELLADGPLTIEMSDYANMEKVGPIGQDFPTNNEQITTEAGDLILYQGNAFVIYYAPNSWNFTRLGKINGITADELKEILGSGDVSVTLSLAAEE